MAESNSRILIQRRKAIDAKKRKIIEKVKKFVREQSTTIENNRRSLGKRQFSGLVDAGAQACCFEELELLISYKGTKGRGNAGSGGLPEELAKSLVVELRNLKNLAKSIKESDCAGVFADLSEEVIHLDIVRLFLGYLFWAASPVIAKKQKKPKSDSSDSQEKGSQSERRHQQRKRQN
jgi:hypothetical protein